MVSRIRNLARTLRHNQTELEGRLWDHLRDRRLGRYKFPRQHPIGNFILDFYCREKKLAVSMVGQQMTRDKNEQPADCLLEKEGIRVLRYWNIDLLQNLDGVLNDILAELESRDGESVN